MMKKKKMKLETLIKETEKTIKAADRPWFERFLNERYPESGRRSSKAGKAAWVSVGSSASAAFLALTDIYLGARSPDVSDIAKAYRQVYETANIAAMPAHISGVNATVNSFRLDLSGYQTETTRYYDALSDDTLYYRVRFLNEETGESGTVSVCVNPDFCFDKRLPDDYKNAKRPEPFTVMCHTSAQKDPGNGVYLVTSTAVTEVGRAALYYEYRQSSPGATNDFAHFFNKTIHTV